MEVVVRRWNVLGESFPSRGMPTDGSSMWVHPHILILEWSTSVHINLLSGFLSTKLLPLPLPLPLPWPGLILSSYLQLGSTLLLPLISPRTRSVFIPLPQFLTQPVPIFYRRLLFILLNSLEGQNLANRSRTTGQYIEATIFSSKSLENVVSHSPSDL